MENNKPDLFSCRVLIVTRNVIETRYQVGYANYDSIKVTASEIAEVIGESVERVSKAIRKLETWGWLEDWHLLKEAYDDGSIYLRGNREMVNDSMKEEIEIGPLSEAIIEWFAEREGLSFGEAGEVLLKLGLKAQGLDLEEGLNKG